MPDLVDVTVVGGGPVGLFAAFYAGLRGMSVRIIDSLPELGGQLVALYPEKYVYDMPGFPAVLAKDLAKGLADQAVQFQPELLLGETADKLDWTEDRWIVTTSQGTACPTKTIIVSAGAGAFSPTKIGVEREDEFFGAGLSYGVQDKSTLEGKRVLVLGGGDSAFDWALGLHGIAADIKLVHRRDVFKAHEETIRQVDALGIEKLLFFAVKELHGDGHLSAVTLENTQTKETTRLDCDALVVNIGFKSSLGPIKDWGLEIEKNQIKVDSLYRTNLDGVFAVGDVATFEGKLKLIATGVGEAATAVCIAKTVIEPGAKLFPGHSSDKEMPNVQ